jgi:hypothetical protein
MDELALPRFVLADIQEVSKLYFCNKSNCSLNFSLILIQLRIIHLILGFKLKGKWNRLDIRSVL